jgi:Tol biopolymer transport system component
VRLRPSSWTILSAGESPPAARIAQQSPGDLGPVWSPDGKRIAFVRESTEGMTDVYLVNPDGSGCDD